MHCFNYADELYLCPIYGASEDSIEGITSDRLVSDINHLHPGLGKKVLETNSDILELVKSSQEQNITLISLGAGSIGKNIRDVVQAIGD